MVDYNDYDYKQLNPTDFLYLKVRIWNKSICLYPYILQLFLFAASTSYRCEQHTM